MEKTKSEVAKYEKPEVKDFGDLRELTEGGWVNTGQDQLWPTKDQAKKSFS